jgi:hypothetical protein
VVQWTSAQINDRANARYTGCLLQAIVVICSQFEIVSSNVICSQFEIVIIEYVSIFRHQRCLPYALHYKVFLATHPASHSVTMRAGDMAGRSSKLQLEGSMTALLMALALAALPGGAQGWRLRDAAPGSLRALPSPSHSVGAVAAPAFQLLPGPLPGASQMTRRARAALRPAAPRHPARISLAHPARRCNTCLSRGRAPPIPLYLPLAGSAPSGRGSCWGSPTGMRPH